MSRLVKLKAEQAKVQDDMESLLATADKEGRDLTAEEAKTFEDLKAQDDKLSASIKVEEDLQRRRAAAARPAAALPGATGSGRTPAQPAEKLEPGVQFARITMALVNGNMDRRAAADWAEQAWGSEAGHIVANLEQSTDTKGGLLVDETHSTDFIGLLRPRVAVRRMGATVLPIPSGNLTMKKQTSGTTATYTGERQPINVTGATVGQLKLSAKKLTAMVPITNQLIRRATLNVEQLVRNDLLAGIAVKEDQQFIRGAGSDLAPAGLVNIAAAGNKIDATDLTGITDAAERVQKVRNDLSRLRLRVINANVPMARCGYILSPSSKEFLENLTDGNGNKAYPEIGEGRIGSYPYAMTTSVPSNLGAGGDESEIIFADFAEVMIGDTYVTTIASSTEAPYHDGTEWQSAFQNDETLIRIITEHDLGTRYDVAIAVLQKVKWKP
ncbi:phage major capsid protein [Azospirillum argentinense]